MSDVPTNPSTGSGCTIGYQSPAGAANPFTPVGRIKSFDPGGSETAKVDFTALSSVAAESFPGIPDNGDVSFVVYWLGAVATAVQLQAWSQKSAVVPWQIQFADGSGPATGTQVNFAAWLSKFKLSGFEINTPIMAEVTITVTGGVQVVPAT